MLSLEQISLTLGDRSLLKDISALVNPQERVGLVGPNGAGKSTMLKIIAGELQPDEGRINLSKDESVGYLPQDGVEPDPNLTLLEEVETAFTELLNLQKKEKVARKKISTTNPGSKEYQLHLQKYGILQNRLEQYGAYNLQADIEKVLMGLGFDTDDFSRRTTAFSGGWLMRIALAKLLFQKPTYLLLDEPTNHLDIESLQWIEDFLSSYKGAVIIVSHDKDFLNRLTERTLWLNNGSLDDYAGNYRWFEKKHAKQLEHRRKAYKNQQREIKQIQEFIDRFRYQANKAKQVQSHIKQLEKIDRIELDEREQEVSFQFPEPERSGAVNMQLDNISKSYGKVQVFDGLTYTIDRSDKIAVIGPNGAGKSTMARILAGTESFDSGRREAGYNVTTAYFAQHQADELDVIKTAFEIMRDAAPMQTETRIRTILGCFLFHGDDVFKKVSQLSGGEKSRLALARMLLTPANFLIFDEPTNHLDMQSKDILQQALTQYKGTIVIVSHDVDFLDPIVTKVLEIQPDETNTYLGNVSWYLQKKEETEHKAVSSDEVSSNQNNRLSRKDERRIKAKRRQRKAKKIKPLKNKLQRVERKVEKLESEKKNIEEAMAESDFYDDSDQVKNTTVRYDRIKAELSEGYTNWECLASKITKIEEKYSN